MLDSIRISKRRGVGILIVPLKKVSYFASDYISAIIKFITFNAIFITNEFKMIK